MASPRTTHAAELTFPYCVGEGASAYYLLRLLGKGSFARVYEAVSQATLGPGQLPRPTTQGDLALKVIPRPTRHPNDAVARRRVKNEITTLRRARNFQHVLPLLATIRSTSNIYLVFQNCRGGSLAGLIAAHGAHGMPERDAWQIVKQIAFGLQGMHASRILHRDLKPDNVLLTAPWPEGEVMVADWGLSREVREDLAQTQLGTPLYTSPEQGGNRNAYTYSSDMWSLGCIAFELVSARRPFPAANHRQLEEMRMNAAGLDLQRAAVQPISDQYNDMVRQLLLVDPELRPTAAQVVELVEQVEAAMPAAGGAAEAAALAAPLDAAVAPPVTLAHDWPGDGCVAMAALAALAAAARYRVDSPSDEHAALDAEVEEVWGLFNPVAPASKVRLVELAAEACGEHASAAADAWKRAAAQAASVLSYSEPSLPWVEALSDRIGPGSGPVVLCTSAARLCAALATLTEAELEGSPGLKWLVAQARELLDKAASEAGRLEGTAEMMECIQQLRSSFDAPMTV